ncbi:MAG: hypothetical protein BYD32DRAFT_428175 [Podila humilis]|nr:MAG: hypothetical protein BYD32DRAFT_428175 [Podila humilis]
MAIYNTLSSVNANTILNINFHAPEKGFHLYFHQHGHRDWSFPTFLSVVAADPEDSVDSANVALTKWHENLNHIHDAPYVPKVVKERIQILLHQKQDVALPRVTFVTKVPTRSADEAVANQLNPSMQAVVRWAQITTAAYINTFQLEINNELSKEATAVLQQFKLAGPISATLLGYLNTFKQAKDWKSMKLLAMEFHSQMELWDAYDQTQEEIYFVREMYTRVAEMWQRHELGIGQDVNTCSQIADLHYHLTDVFNAIRHVSVRHRDIDDFSTVHSKKSDVVVSYDLLSLDVVCIRLNPHESRPGLKDTEAVANALASNLDFALTYIPRNHQDKYKHALRSYGMIDSRKFVTLLEARYLDNVPVIFPILSFEIPKSQSDCALFVDGLAHMIAFKDRIKAYIESLAHMIPPH